MSRFPSHRSRQISEEIPFFGSCAEIQPAIPSTSLLFLFWLCPHTFSILTSIFLCTHWKFIHHLIFEDYFMSSSFQMVPFSWCGITQSIENIGCVNYSCLQRSLLFLVVLLVELVAWTHHQKVADAAAQTTSDFANILCFLILVFQTALIWKTQSLPAQTTHLLEQTWLFSEP